VRLLGGKLAKGTAQADNDNRIVPANTGRKFHQTTPQNEITTMIPTSVALGVLTPILLDATTGYHTFSVPSAIKNHTFYIRGNGPVSSGSIQLRTASSPQYTGTFAPYSNPILVYPNTERVVNIPQALFHVVRVEVALPIAGGTVSVFYKGD
jgi:hypothetical protein